MLIIMLVVLGAAILSGFPVAFVLAGVSIIFAFLGHIVGIFDIELLHVLPLRIYGIMSNDLLIAVPLFVFMGSLLQRANIAEALLLNMASLFGNIKGGLAISVMVVGALLAASTGIVGATVVTMGLISLPAMLNHGYHPRIATGTICAAGTLGQIIPPSIVLILLGDQISNAFQLSQMSAGNLSPEPVSIADIFVGALLPGLGLVILYMLWQLIYCKFQPSHSSAPSNHPISGPGRTSLRSIITTLIPPLLLILIVLGSILTGLATATESAAVGAMGAILLALKEKQLTKENLVHTIQTTATTCAMVFGILIGATIFTLVFRGYGGDLAVHHFLTNLPGGLFSVMLLTMLLMFVLGFFLDFIEIIFVVVPIVAPIILGMGADPIWLAVMIAINLQTSFLTPPFGFALFYLRGVAPKNITTSDIYKGVIPFIIIQLLMLVILSLTPRFATWLPHILYRDHTDQFTHEENFIDDMVIEEVDF